MIMIMRLMSQRDTHDLLEPTKADSSSQEGSDPVEQPP